MRKIITVSREFGSGGRELGKRLAEIFGMNYVDGEIAGAVSEEKSLYETYLSGKYESGIFGYPPSGAHSFSCIGSVNNSAMMIARQHKIIREIAARTDCVIIGRGASAVLNEFRPFRIFVYADMPSKIARCRSRADGGEDLSDKQIERKIKSIDGARKKTHELYAAYGWGDKAGYDLCINTSGADIARVAEITAEYASEYFKRNSVQGE